MAVSAVTFVGPGKVRTMDALGTWTGYTSLTLNTTNFIEGTGSLSEKVSNTTIQGYGITAADWTGEPWNFASGQTHDGDHIFVWLTAYEGWDTLANGGFRIRIADDLATDSVGTWYVGPQPGYLGGWYSYVINPAANFNEVTAGTAGWTTTGNPAQLTGVDGFGSGWKINKTIAGAIDNCFMDAIVVGKGYQITNGDAGSLEGKFSDFTTYEDTNRFGPLRTQSGILFARCKLYIGASSGATATEFIDSGFTVVWEKAVLSDGTSSAVATDYYALILQKGTGTTDVTLSNGSLTAVSPHEVYLKFTGATSVSLSNVSVTRARLIDLDGAVTWSGGTINESGLMTLSGSATVTGITFIAGTDSSTLLVQSPSYLDNVDNCSFTSDGSNHAIEITGTAANVTLTNITFTSYAASDGSTGNEAIFVNIATGSMNITISGGTTPSIRTAGCAVTVISGAVSVTAKTVTDAGVAISGARLHLEAAAGGPFPANATVTITNSSTTATVSHTAHGMATNDKVVIRGASHVPNNGVFTITKINNDSYSYVMASAPGSNPTGTITSSFVVLNGTTNVNGEITMSRVFPSAQPVTGNARKSSSAPFYKSAALAGTVSSSLGGNFTAVMISDD
jgi:hypothetical protein